MKIGLITLSAIMIFIANKTLGAFIKLYIIYNPLLDFFLIIKCLYYCCYFYFKEMEKIC